MARDAGPALGVRGVLQPADGRGRRAPRGRYSEPSDGHGRGPRNATCVLTPSGSGGGPNTKLRVIVRLELAGRGPAQGLPRAPARTWLPDDEVADLARQLDPLLAALPADLAAQVGAEFAVLR
jgi:hypothetical protein